MSCSRVLFLLKSRHDYDGYGNLSSGLLNSAKFVSDMLAASGVESRVAVVVDNNSIDKEVHEYKPNVVIIEALWVVPQKFEILQRLHPSVKWIVRTHSEIPFLANEGIAVEWIKKYVQHKNVFVASNSLTSIADLKRIVATVDSASQSKVVYLPNYYPVPECCPVIKNESKKMINIGCFGAIRPLKNQLIQALAAIDFGNKNDKQVYFHINSTRNEQRGDSNLENIRALFHGTKHKLVEHQWLNLPDFLALLRKMDVSMCVSLTETFCLVAANTVVAGCPLVCSPEVSWSCPSSQVNPTDTGAIVSRIGHVTGLLRRAIVWCNFKKLDGFSRISRKVWLRYLGCK